MGRRFIAYYRVSTQQQGRSGLGLDAQRDAVRSFIESRAGTLVDEVEEIETGKGTDALRTRPVLRRAMEQCKKRGCTLLIAKLDRLARNVHFVSGLIELGVDFVAADMPEANKVMLQMHSVMAEWERDQISARTKAALNAAKSRGVRLGVKGAENLRPAIDIRIAEANAFAARLSSVLEGFRLRGLTQRQMVDELNALGLTTARGGRWSLIQLQRVLSRLTHREDSALAH